MSFNKIDRLKCLDIKSRLERLSGIKDIGVNTNLREISDFKKCYCFLARKFTDASLSNIAEVLRIGYTHDSVHRNINEFNKLYPQKVFSKNCTDAFENTLNHYNSLNDNFSDIEDLIKSQPALNDSYVDILMKLILKAHSIINKKNKKIEELKQSIKTIVDNSI